MTGAKSTRARKAEHEPPRDVRHNVGGIGGEEFVDSRSRVGPVGDECADGVVERVVTVDRRVGFDGRGIARRCLATGVGDRRHGSVKSVHRTSFARSHSATT